MAPSPDFKVPEGMEGKSLAGVRPCGCITSAMAVSTDPRYRTTEKDVRDFYADMARTGREVRWIDTEEIRAQMGPCLHGEGARS